MAEMQLVQNVAPHSLEISRNASGGVSFSVKCYGETIEEAAEKATKMFVELNGTYPANVKI